MAPIYKSVALALLFLAPLTTMAAPVNRRQLGGEGAACDSILSDTDNATGYGIANAEENTAATISGTPRPHVKRRALARRQGNKIADGAVPLFNALGLAQLGQYEDQNGDYIDEVSTGDVAQLGDQIGTEEETSIEGAGAMVPRK